MIVALRDEINIPKLSTYCQFKSTLELDSYMFSDMLWTYTISLAKFLCTNNKLATIEIFRGSLPRSERVCVFCLNYINVRVIEDKYHFMSVCPLYAHLRATLVPNLVNDNSF